MARSRLLDLSAFWSIWSAENESIIRIQFRIPSSRSPQRFPPFVTPTGDLRHRVLGYSNRIVSWIPIVGLGIAACPIRKAVTGID